MVEVEQRFVEVNRRWDFNDREAEIIFLRILIILIARNAGPSTR